MEVTSQIAKMKRKVYLCQTHLFFSIRHFYKNMKLIVAQNLRTNSASAEEQSLIFSI